MLLGWRLLRKARALALRVWRFETNSWWPEYYSIFSPWKINAKINQLVWCGNITAPLQWCGNIKMRKHHCTIEPRGRSRPACHPTSFLRPALPMATQQTNEASSRTQQHSKEIIITMYITTKGQGHHFNFLGGHFFIFFNADGPPAPSNDAPAKGRAMA